MIKIILLSAIVLLGGIFLAGCISRNDSRQDTTTTNEYNQPETSSPEQPVASDTAMEEPVNNSEYSKYEGTTELKVENFEAGNTANTTKSKNGDTVTVHYTGYFINGEKFDSSRDAGTPFSFVLGAGRVIKAWDQGFVDKNVGDKFRLVVPPTLGYGAQDYGPIPGNSVLVFEVEIIDIKAS